MTGEQLAEIYDEHANALYAFLLNLTRSEQDARDILHDVFVRFAHQSEPTGLIHNMRAWLIKCCHRTAIDAFRKNANRLKAHHSSQQQAELFMNSAVPADDDFAKNAAEALQSLPSEQRAVVHLKIWEDMTFAQIGEALKIPANTAASRYRYALIKLKDALEPQPNQMIV